MGFGNLDEFAKVFPYRQTSITIGQPLPSVVQPWTAFERSADEMAKTANAVKENVTYIPGIGWQLRGLQFDYGSLTELTGSQAGFYTAANGKLTTATDFAVFNIFAQDSLTGVTYNPNVQSSGTPFHQKRVADGDTWNNALSADQTAWPSPDTSSDAVSMDRVAKSTANHDPEDALFFSFFIPGSPVPGLSTVAAIHFTGPAGGDDKAIGNGQYCLKIRADGTARLYERQTSDNAWIYRHQLKWNVGNNNQVASVMTLSIFSNSRDAGGGSFYGNRILFAPTSFQETDFFSVLTATAKAAMMQGNPKSFGLLYEVPQIEVNPSVVAPVRIDIRRDVRLAWTIGQLTYPDSGVLFDDVFSLPFPPTATDDTPFFLYWWGYVPAGCSLTAQLYDADTGVVLSDQTDVLIDEFGGIRSFTPNLLQRRYRVRIEFTSDGSNEKTPTLTNVQVLRTNLFETPTLDTVTVPRREAAPALPATVIETLSVTGQSGDPGGAGAGFAIHDFTGELATALQKAGQPVKIETTYDVGGTNKSTLFQGYIQTASSSQMRGDKAGYAGEDWRRYDVECAGEWQRLQEAMSPFKFTWFDKAANLPYKVTDVVRDLLLTCYPQDMVDVPDLETRLWSFDNNAFVLEPGASIGDAAFSIAQQYLGAYLIFDENAGTVGKWRMLQQKQPPYNILAKFYIEHPGTGKLPHVSASYGSSTSGSQTILHTYIKRDSDRYWVERAEGNLVIVIGGTAASAITGQSSSIAQGVENTMLTQVAVNVDSYNFLGLSPGDPGYPDGTDIDYIGRCVPIVVRDRTLTTQFGVDFIARRTYDYAAHARQRLSFIAPMLLVTDSTDTEQTRPRKLTYYDPVQVQQQDGSFLTYLVLSCSPAYSKDGFQFARYELVRQKNIDDLAVMPQTPGSVVGLMRRTIQQMTGGVVNNPGWAANSPAERNESKWMGLAERIGSSIQDLDNTSPTFGDFYYMMGYDPLP